MMMKKAFAPTLAVLIVLSMLLGGCGGSKAATKVVTLTYPQEFDSLSPLYTDMWFSWTTWQMFEHWPWEYDENNKPFPVMITEIPSEENGGVSADGRVITMHLIDGLKWSDNKPLTADDFIFTWQMAVSPKNAVTSAYPYDKVESVTAPDAKTVVVTFTDPFAPWQTSLWHGLLPKHILQPVYDSEGTIDNAEWVKNPTVGFGPYVLEQWEKGSFARFVKNNNYWGKAPKIPEVFIRFVPDDAAQVAALKAGDSDLGTFIAYSDVPALKDAGLNLVTEPSGYSEWLFFLVDAKKGHPALLDVNVRKAIALAIDPAGINQDLHFGLTKTPASFWDALPYYNDPPLTPYPHDPEQAKKLLDQAGWIDSNGNGIRDKGGVELELDHATTIRKDRQDVQAVMQQELADVGIKLNIASVDDTLYFASYADGGPAAKGEYDIMEWSDGPLFPDPDLYYWLCSEIPTNEYPTGSNWFYICDEELDRLITLQSTQVDLVERQKTISQINQLFYDKVYIIGLWQDPDVYAVGPRLQNVKFSGATMFFNIADWELKK
jgi:peptide/nickel transport system substrate-binding protein